MTRAAIALVVALSAQTPAPAVVNPIAGQPIMFTAEHDGRWVEWFTLYVDGQYAAHVGLEALKAGTFSIRLEKGLAAGPHDVAVEACTDHDITGAGACSPKTKLAIVVDALAPGSTPPLTPANLRIIR